jgi:hypothetical protein
MERAALDQVLERQAGVVARRQILALGGRDSDIARMIRRRELMRIHEGVFVTHTGQFLTGERAWAAVLFYWPAVLCHRSALDWDADLRIVTKTEIHVAIDAARRVARRVARLPGVVVHRVKDFDAVALMNLSPPRARIEHAALEVASDAPSESRAVGVLADVCQSRRTTASRLLARLEQMPRLRRRRLLRTILTDVESGAYSVLERMYLRTVERPHGLPLAQRQRCVREGRSRAYRDVEYLEELLLVELDGRLGHERALDRWADLDRDVAAAVDQRVTVRLGYGQVLQPCRVAAALARILRARGWIGSPRACAPGCPVGQIRGEIHSSGEGIPPQIA